MQPGDQEQQIHAEIHANIGRDEWNQRRAALYRTVTGDDIEAIAARQEFFLSAIMQILLDIRDRLDDSVGQA